MDRRSANGRLPVPSKDGYKNDDKAKNFIIKTQRIKLALNTASPAYVDVVAEVCKRRFSNLRRGPRAELLLLLRDAADDGLACVPSSSSADTVAENP
eukprot:scaffold1063_cov136-Amphora_coffeaeformis.AAC.1